MSENENSVVDFNQSEQPLLEVSARNVVKAQNGSAHGRFSATGLAHYTQSFTFFKFKRNSVNCFKIFSRSTEKRA